MKNLNSFDSIKAHDIASRTTNAYMHDNYGDDWVKVIGVLMQEGYTADQTEFIVRSKHMRWASDSFSATLSGFWMYYIGKPDRSAGKDMINEMIKEYL